jgi:hypothetical protein
MGGPFLEERLGVPGRLEVKLLEGEGDVVSGLEV